MQWDDTLVIGVASSAPFDLSESHAVFTVTCDPEYPDRDFADGEVMRIEVSSRTTFYGTDRKGLQNSAEEHILLQNVT